MKASNYYLPFLSILILANGTDLPATAQTKPAHQQAAGKPLTVWDELTARAGKFVQQQNMNAAEPVMQLALSEAKKTPADKVRLAKSYENLGWLYFRQGKYLQAQPYLNQLLSLAEKASEPEVVQSGIGAVDALAFMDLQQGRYPQAESLYGRLAGASLRIPELTPIITMEGVLGKANVLAVEGRYTEARKLLADSQTVLNKIVPPPVPTGQAKDLKQFALQFRQALLHGFITVFRYRMEFDQQVATGNLFLQEGHLEQAEACYRRGCTKFRNDFKREAPAIVLGYIGLGRACLLRGKLTDAQDYFQKSKAILEREAIQERPFVETCQINIAECLTRSGKPNEAQSILVSSKTSLEKNLGAETAPVADCYLGLANAAKAAGKSDEAESNYRKCLAIKEKLFGKDSDKLGSAQNQLADLLLKSGKEAEAQQLFAQCVESHEKRSLPGNVQACRAMIGQGNLEKKQGNLDKAELLYRNALNGLERNLMTTDPVLLDTYKSLGDIYLSQKKFPEAESVLRRQLRGLDLLAKQDENTASAINSLSLALGGQQKYSDEEKLLSRLLAMFEANKSFDKEKSGSALKDYSDVLKKLSRDPEAERVAERVQKLGSSDPSTKQSTTSDEKAAEKNSGDSSKPGSAK